jgi:hypothetical protein
MTAQHRHWLMNPGKEFILIMAPLLAPVIIVFAFRGYFESHTEVNSWWWLLLVLLVDVSHVYSTVFRFYWEKNTFQKYRSLLIIIPVTAFGLGVMIHWYDSFLFWRLLAYAALYHFIRQQYGFMRLYARQQNQTPFQKWIDGITIYATTIYPVLYWHLHLTETLSWFVPHDFISIQFPYADEILLSFYLLILVCYEIKEVLLSLRARDWNVPKNILVLGTALSWYTGIIVFNGDLTFTFLNVVAHGVPYMGLVWMYGEKKSSTTFNFGLKGILIFFSAVFTLSYFEESIWDVFVWKDHPSIFPFFTHYEGVHDPVVLSLLVPLLVLPQITHYVLDGFIWRFSKDANARL